MNTNMSLRNDRFRTEMELNPILQKVIAVYHIIQVIAIITCLAYVVIKLEVYIVFFVIIPVILFIILWVASKCNCQDLVVLLVHYNPILSTTCFLLVFPLFVIACIKNQNMYMYYNISLYEVPVLVIAVMTGIISLGSAVFAVMGIWKSARHVVLIARSGEYDSVNAVGCVQPTYDAPVTFTDLNGK
ncbi:hypothetical protein ACJMK2_028394 [Sinanodonta woodiana]|uniref:Uncharacterized protein n=1 Tax=Sinanodonta woodiana TaxID=1069815 RepID=A0ABD3XAW4_SINWO